MQQDFPSALTGLSDDDVMRQGCSVLVLSSTLIRPLVGFSLFSADVDYKSPRARFHQDFGVFVHVKVSAVSRPGETKIEKRRSRKEINKKEKKTEKLVQLF